MFTVDVETRAFDHFVRRYVESTCNGNAQAAIRRLALALLAKVIEKAPVDTGRHRAGWAVAAEKIGIPRLPPIAKTDKRGRPVRPLSTEERGSFKQSGAGGRIVVEYSMLLEHGSSRQAPFGMVRISMRELEAELSGLSSEARLPRGIRQVYVETWKRGGITSRPAEGMGIADTLGITHGSGGF
ncbi:MAG: hypothetical protein VW405_02375 [Rhodospirillaceae bacterium]